jgi:hypothetical protein
MLRRVGVLRNRPKAKEQIVQKITLWVRRALLGSTLAFASLSAYGCLAEDDSPFEDTVGSEAEAAEEISESDEAALGSEAETAEEISESDEAALGLSTTDDGATASSELAVRPGCYRRFLCWQQGESGCNSHCRRVCRAKKGECQGFRRTCVCIY